MATTPGPIALVGSGEFLPQMRDVDRLLLEGRSMRACIVPTASAPEGATTFARWVRMGVEHYTAIGAEPVPVEVVDRATADDPELAALIDGAGLVYLSGGNPGYLAATLEGTAVWRAIVAAWEGGAALAGCSAGAMALSTRAPDVRGRTGRKAGLGLVADLAVLPHFDRWERWRRGSAASALRELPDGVELVGVDEDTALVRMAPDGPWVCQGRQRCWHLRRDGTRVSASHGEVLAV